MKDLKKLNELKVSKQNEMSALVDKVKKEERAMTPEENELFDQWMKENVLVLFKNKRSVK